MPGEIPREVKLSRQGTCQSLIDLFIILIVPVSYILNFAHKKSANCSARTQFLYTGSRLQ